MVFIKSSKNQNWTLPPDIRDLIPSDHICYLVESFVDEMNFSEFEIRYDGSGHPAYHPCIMCKILIQSMLDRVRSSRAIARNVRENVVYIYLAENLQPDFRTISDFRKENDKLITELFKNTVKAARDLGVIGLEQLSTDGSMVKASASKNNVVLEEVLKVIGEYVNIELKKGIEVDRLEDENFGNCRGYDQLNESGKYKVKAVVAKYIRQVNKDNSNKRKKEIRDIVKEALNEFEKDSIEKVSLTDKESRFMKNKKGIFELAYNAQITVDHKLGIIVANEDGIRHLKIAEFSKERKQLADKMETEEAKKIYGQRKQVVEPAIGNYKENLGFREFLTRGLKSVKNEFNLVCTAVNLRKIWIYSNKNKIIRMKNRNKWNFSF